MSIAYGWSPSGVATSFVPRLPSTCDRCEEHAPAAFILVARPEIEAWACQACISDLESRGIEFHEIVSAKELSR